MALTREYRETVVERIKNDRKFTAALYAEAIAALIDGEKAESFSILRDLVHAHISFKALAEQTGFDEKALHRMLGAKGNPTTDNLVLLLHTIGEDLNLTAHIEARRSQSVA